MKRLRNYIGALKVYLRFPWHNSEVVPSEPEVAEETKETSSS